MTNFFQLADHSQEETPWGKYRALLGLLLATSLSVGLFKLNKNNWITQMTFIADHPSAVGIVVQIISYFFGLLCTYGLCKSGRQNRRTIHLLAR